MPVDGYSTLSKALSPRDNKESDLVLVQTGTLKQGHRRSQSGNHKSFKFKHTRLATYDGFKPVASAEESPDKNGADVSSKPRVDMPNFFAESI